MMKINAGLYRIEPSAGEVLRAVDVLVSAIHFIKPSLQQNAADLVTRLFDRFTP